MIDIFKELGDYFEPESQRKPVRYIKLVMEENQVIAELKDGIKLGYLRQFNCIKIMRDAEELRMEVVPEGYTLNQFIDDCWKYSRIYNYLT